MPSPVILVQASTRRSSVLSPSSSTERSPSDSQTEVSHPSQSLSVHTSPSDQTFSLPSLAIDHLDGVQNLRKAVYDYKLKAEAAPDGTTKQATLHELGINYLYRYAVLIVLANYLIDSRGELKAAVAGEGEGREGGFPSWLREHREIKSVLRVSSLD